VRKQEAFILVKNETMENSREGGNHVCLPGWAIKLRDKGKGKGGRTKGMESQGLGQKF